MSELEKEERNYKVYKLTSPENKVYIGMTCQELEHRFGKNGNGYLKKSEYNEYEQPVIASAINKFGWENFTHEILFQTNDKKLAEDKEIEMIEFYNSTNLMFGYNMQKGGMLTQKGREVSEKET